MKIRDIFSAKAFAAYFTTDPNLNMEYLGAGLFPAKKKLGLDLKWIKGHRGLSASLAPSNFDAKSTLRSREGFKVENTEMPFFRESMIVKEADEQEIMRVQDTNDPYAEEILGRIFDDVSALTEGSMATTERMRMQLLAPVNEGHPQIFFSHNGVTYAYNYDPDGSYAENNYEVLTGTDKWDDFDNADPIKDIEDARDAVLEKTGNRPTRIIMSKETLNKMKQCKKVQNAVLSRAVNPVVVFTDSIIKDAIKQYTDCDIIVYNKKVLDEEKRAVQLYPDGYITLIPDGALGSTWFGTTPEERTLAGTPGADVSIVATGVAVAVTTTNDPVNTKTTVSMIALPSYERMDETYCIKVF